MSEHVRPTKKQRELLEYIESFIGEHGYSPSYREIMNGLHYNSVATVALHVGNLIKRGHLVKREHSARSLEVVRATGAASSAPATAEVHEAWLVGQVENHLYQSANSSAPADNQLAEGQLLINALHLLGLAEQAAALQAKLSELHQLPASSEKAV